VPLDAFASLRYHAPELMLVLSLVFVVLADLVFKRFGAERRLGPFDVVALLTLVGLVASGGFVFYFDLFHAPAAGLFSNMVALDNFGVLLRLFFILTAILVVLMSIPSREIAGVHQGELFAFLLAVTASMMWMANAINLIMIFLALEMVSVISYIMVGYLRTERLSNEAALKYILFGAVSTGSMLYGMSLLYGLTGTLDVGGIRAAIASGAVAQAGPALLLVVVLVLAGIGFKIAAVPFHFWCPDVYTGAPTPVTAFLSVGPKVAGFAVLVRIFFGGLAEPGLPGGPDGEGAWRMIGPVNWQAVLIGVSLATMTLGNVAALLQTNLKRLLAYSSIAHAGFILMGAVVLSGEGIQAMLAYMIVYLFMNLGAFLVVIVIYDSLGSFQIKDYAGMWRRSPGLTLAMAVFLLSLMGIPPFFGFLAKYYVFAAVIRAGIGWFAVAGVLNSVVAVVYYMKILKAMVVEEGEAEPLRFHPIYAALLALFCVPNLIGLLFWGPLDRLTDYSLKLLDRM
jgi:NADH-quinone oxidoreductase subunit N